LVGWEGEEVRQDSGADEAGRASEDEVHCSAAQVYGGEESREEGSC
jgi:hypothetical protein